MSVKGYPTQKKDTSHKSEFATVEPVRTGQHGLSVLSHQTFRKVSDETTTTGSTTTVVEIATSTSAQAGDVIYFRSGTLDGIETKIISVSGTSLTVADELPSAPANGVSVDILRHKFPVVDDDGNFVINAGLMSFQKDGSATLVTEDTSTPANNVPLPVKLTGVTGDITITADNLDVQSTHVGANADSIRIGDGTEELAINADGSINTTINAAIPAGTNNIGDVDVASIAAGDNNIGNVDIVTLPGTVETDIGAIKTAVETIDNAISGTEMQVDVVTLPALPAGTNNIGDVDIASLPGTVASDITDIKTAVETIDNAISGSEMQVDVVTLPALPAGTNNIGDVDVASLPALPAGTNTIGKIDLNTLSVVDFIDTTPVLDTSSTTINGSAGSFVEIIASTAAAAKKVRVSDTTGQFIGVYTGAAASESLAFIINPGMDGEIEHFISAGTRVSLRAMGSGSISVGEVCLQLLG